MSPDNSTSPHKDYFNDLSRQPSIRSNRSNSPLNLSGIQQEDSAVPRPKRIACIICRKRKLKCDGIKPSCGTCSRLGHMCAYDEIRRKSGPKRGYVKELEARLAQVETQLKSKNPGKLAASNRAVYKNQGQLPVPRASFQLNDLDMGLSMGDQDMMSDFVDATRDVSSSQNMRNIIPTTEIPPPGSNDTMSWDMIGLGLEEPLPPQDMIDELHQLYFDKIHPTVPMMHKYRYLAAMNLAPHMRPAICLRYAIWALACSVTEKYMHFQEVFYQRARKYAESDEMKGHGESFITVGHAQCWILVATYEYKMMYFPRAWMSTGRGNRLVQMMGLHRLDGVGLEVKQCLSPPRDWTDREERRRTFWSAYCQDRYASIGTGWPMTIEDKDIMTNLPATEEAFDRSRAQSTLCLAEAMTAEGASSLSSYAGVVLLSCLFGRNLLHLHRPDPNDRPEDPANGEFWKRHRTLDNILLNTSMFLPDHLRLPGGIKDANIILLNLNIHTSTICLHQAAILKAEKHQCGSDVIKQSTDRCFLAAEEIVNIMHLTGHTDVGNLNPFVSFCLYVAARIYVHAYKKHSEDQQIRSNLDFILSAMQAMRKKNPLAESFLVQLMVDLDGSGLDHPLNNSRFSFSLKKGISATLAEGGCPTIFQSHSTSQPSHLDLRGNMAGIRLRSAPLEEPHDLNLDIPSTQFTMPSYSIPTREHRSSQQGYQFNPNSSQRQNSGTHQSWHESNPARTDYHGQRGPRGANGHVFDTEMASDQTSDRQNSLSEYPTPTHSQHGSSNTSYSPATIDETDPSNHHPSDPITAGPATTFFHPSAPFAGFTSPEFTAPPDSENFGIPPGWDLGPGNGSTSLGEAGWTQMLEGMPWENSAMATGEMPWRPSAAHH